MAGVAEQINDARTAWASLDREAKAKHVEVEKWVNGELAKFAEEHKRRPTVGDELFDRIDAALLERDQLRERADAARATYDQLIRVNHVGAYSAEDVVGAQRRDAIRTVARRLGERIVGSDQYHHLQALAAETGSDQSLIDRIGGMGRFSLGQLMSRDEFEVLTLGGMSPRATTVTGGGSTSGAPFIQNDVQAGFVAYRRKAPVMLGLVGSGATDSDTVEYVRQTAVAAAAAEVAEDTASAEATITFETVTTDVRDIAHHVPITRRAIADAGQLQTIVENDLLGGVIDRIDTQIASGDAAGVNLRGIYNTSGIQTQALGVDPRPDALHKAMTLVAIAPGVLGEVDAVGMHPSDWQDLRLEKNGNDEYRYGPPAIAGQRSVFGVSVVSSTVFTSGTPLTGMFNAHSTAWIREAPTVFIGLNADDFTKRRLTILAEARLAFAVKRATAFCTITGF
jgi:HK97 family phage major capsid protein